MGKRRPNAMGRKVVTKVDPLALAELQAASIDARIRRGLPRTRQQRQWKWTPELAAATDRIQAMDGYEARGRHLKRALTDDRPWVQILAMKIVDALEDRLRGRPQATEPTHGNLIVHFGGLDPSRLPDALPKPALPKEANGQVVPPKAVNPVDPED
jgi:hypothetical protein